MGSDETSNIGKSPPGGGRHNQRSRNALARLSEVRRSPLVVRELDALDDLRQEGKPWRAEHALSRAIGQLDKADRIDDVRRWLWIRAHRQLLECFADRKKVIGIAPVLRRFVEETRTDAWTAWRHEVAEQYRRLIGLHVHLRQFQDALDAYGECRDILSLDVDTRYRLAVASVELGRGDESAAEIYLSYLEAPGRLDDPERARILDALRRALRIDLEGPEDDRLEVVMGYNQRAYSALRLLWAKVHIAVGTLRQGRTDVALETAGECVPLDEADGDALILLGIVFSIGEEWDRASAMFSRARAELGETPAGIFYAALSGAHRALLHPGTYEESAAYRAVLDECQRALAAPVLQGKGVLDVAWVRLHLAVARGDAEAIEAYSQPDVSVLPKWRQMAAWVQALWARGDIDALRQWIDSCGPAQRLRMFLGRAGEALWRLLDCDVEAARESVSIVAQLVADEKVAGAETDIAAAARCLQHELDLLSGQEGTPRELYEGTPAVRAHQLRLEAWEAVLEGRMDDALTHAAERQHQAGAAWLIDLVKAVASAYKGDVERAESLIRGLAAQAEDRRPHRVLAGLWHLSRGRHAEAVEALLPVVQEENAPLDALMGCAEALTGCGRVDDARALLSRAARTAMQSPVQPLTYRPWRLRIPVDDWSRGRSLGPLADLCHLADLLLAADLGRDAVPILDRAADLLVRGCVAAHTWLGGLLARAARRLLQIGEFDRACELHKEAAQHLDTARLTEMFDEPFAEALAGAIMVTQDREGGTLGLSDAVLEEFVDYAEKWDGSPAEFGDTRSGALLGTGLLIDDDVPAATAERGRRSTWTELLAAALPGWPWPHRNLARAALCAGDPAACLDHLTRIDDELLGGEDHWLRGRALYESADYGGAADAFGEALGAGFQASSARIMRGVCGAAEAWLGPAEGAIAAEQFLADLTVPPLEGGVPSEMVELATVWRAAALLGAGRCKEVIDLLAHFEPRNEPSSVVLALRGLAQARVGMRDAAIAAWTAASAQLPPNDDIGVLVLWAKLAGPGYAIHSELAELVARLHRGGRTDAAFQLLAARFEFRRGRPDAGRERLESAHDAVTQWRHLPLVLLNHQVRIEAGFVAARSLLAEGKPAAASAALSEVAAADNWFANGRVRYYEGLALAHAGKMSDACAALTPLAEGDDCDAAAAIARLAATNGDRDEAERWTDKALRIEAGHPLALLVKAELAEARGDINAARGYLQQVAADDAAALASIPAAFREAACLALGRLAEGARNWDEAEEHYRSAMTAAPEGVAALRRLACLWGRMEAPAQELLTAHGARQILEMLAGLPSSRRTLRGLLARAFLGERVGVSDGDPEKQVALARNLSEIVQHPDRARLEPAQRATLARWSIHVQLRLGRFSEAAQAVKALLATDDLPELRNLLVDCRMLEATRLLREHALDAEVLDQIEAAVKDVLAQRPDHQVALLLAATAKVLRGGEPGEEHAALVARLRDADLPSADMQLLAEVNRLFVGVSDKDGSARTVERLDRLAERTALTPETRLFLELLAANLCGDQERLMILFERSVPRALQRAWDLPVAAAELAVFVAGVYLARGSREKAEGALRKVHAEGAGNDASRQLLALILVRQGIDSLRQQLLPDARERIIEARDVLGAQTQQGNETAETPAAARGVE